jgi:hypothetical protein
MNDSIKSYLYNYYDDAKKIKLQNDYKHVLRMRHEIGNFLSEYFKKNNHIKNIVKHNQIGGDVTEYLEKLNKISTLYKMYKDINPEELNIKMKTLDDELGLLLNEFKDFDISKIGDNATKLLNPDMIMTNIQTMRHSIKDFGNNIKITPERTSLYTPLPINDLPTGYHDTSYYLGILAKSTAMFSEYMKASGTDRTRYEGDLFILSKEIDKNIEILKSNIIKLDEISEKLNNEIIIFDKSLTIIKDDVKLNMMALMPIEDLIKKIDLLPNEETSSHRGFNNFKKIMREENSKYIAKRIKYRDLIDKYNSEVSKLSDKRDLPDPYFDGNYTVRINNNFFAKRSASDREIKFEIVRSMVKNNTTTDQQIVKEIYAPNFELVKKGIMAGGTIDDDVQLKLANFSTFVSKYQNSINVYNSAVHKYNQSVLHNFIHTIFLALVGTNQLFIDGSYVVYNYINKGILEFYKRIIINILAKIDNNARDDEIIYLHKYHYVTLMKLKHFIDEITQLMDPKTVIDIRRCNGEVSKRFFLLNYFKTILESYNEMFQNRITIYARINDIKHSYTTEEYNSKKMFISDYERKDLMNNLTTTNEPLLNAIKSKTTSFGFNDEKIDTSRMIVNNNACSGSKVENENIFDAYKFTEVFDTNNFPTNGDISKYMSLDSQLMKGKGVSIMTYGYSGTGKTFTLFGSRDENKEGILQSTLDNINGLEYVNFRLFEVHGRGLAYPHYWKNDDKTSRLKDIAHKIYHYELKLSHDKISKTEVVESYDGNNIKKYMENTHGKNSYTKIMGEFVSDIFRNFDSFINSIEDYRRRPDILRVRDTPNNIVSSRSVLIYDFQLKIENIKDEIPFIIVDLPGREEIIQTYVDPYINNSIIVNKIFKNDESELLKIRFMLSVMALNPLGLPVFDSHVVVDTINNHKNREEIITAELPFVFEFNKTQATEGRKDPEAVMRELDKKYIFETIEGKTYITKVRDHSMKGRNFMLEEEMIGLKGISLGRVFKRSSDRKIIVNSDIPFVKGSGKPGDVFNGFGYLLRNDNNKNKSQYYSLVSIHLMNRLIKMNRFDIIEEIYMKVCDKHLNKFIRTYVEGITTITGLKDLQEGLVKSNFKSELISKIDIDSVSKGKSELIKYMSYDYYLTPFEGIYINENIIGLIQYLASNLITNEAERNEYKIMSQPEGLKFAYQQKVVRTWLISNPEITSDKIKSFYNFSASEAVPRPLLLEDTKHDGTTDTYLSTESMKEEYKILRESYHSDRIFNNDIPIITDILDMYIKKIKDYKVFYLFGNYRDDMTRDLKCTHQNALLKNTKDFIKIITKN